MGNCLVTTGKLEKILAANSVTLGRTLTAKLEASLEKLATKEEMEKLQNGIDQLNNELLVPKGHAFATKVTVTISYAGSKSGFPHGHGLVLKNNGNFYLVSAAHVLITLPFNGDIVLKADNNDSLKPLQPCKTGALFVPRRYITQGIPDVGLLHLVDFDREMICTCEKTSAAVPKIGNAVVGRGRAFLRGDVTGDITSNVADANVRFSILGHSMPGSSGTPLFNESEEFVAVVHGDGKHRGRRKHSTSSDTDKGVSVVYADSPHNLKNLVRITKEEIRECLKHAEDVDEDISSGSKSLHEWAKEVKESLPLETLIARYWPGGMPEELQLEQVMKELAEEVDESSEDSDVNLDGEIEVVSGVKTKTRG